MKKLTIMILCFAVTLGLEACGLEQKSESKTADGNKDLQIHNTSSERSDETSKVNRSDTVSAFSGQAGISSDKTNNPAPQSSNTEFNAAEYQKLGEKLLKELEKKTASGLTFFDVADKLSYQGYEPIENVGKFQKIEPCAEIEDAGKISEFKKFLKLDQWQVDTLKVSNMPKVFIYFDNDLHVNLEAQTDKSWMSINSPSGSAFYLVPNEVYHTLLEKYSK